MTIDDVAESLERLLEMLFEEKPRVIAANRDAHNGKLYYVHGSRFTVQGFTVPGS